MTCERPPLPQVFALPLATDRQLRVLRVGDEGTIAVSIEILGDYLPRFVDKQLRKGVGEPECLGRAFKAFVLFK